MQEPQHLLVCFFEQVAQKNKPQLDALKQDTSFTFDAEHWYFTLPDLYQFFNKNNLLLEAVDYKKFRQLVYASPVNKAIKPHNAKIIIDDNHGKSDKNRYALVWRDPVKV